MKVKFVFLAVTLLLLSLAPTFAVADELEPDSVILLCTRPNAAGDDSTLTVELYFWVDGDTLNGASMGFEWVSDDMTLVSATPSSVASTAFLSNILLPSNSVSEANATKHFQYVGVRLFTPGLQPSPSRQLMATYEFTLSNWTGGSTITLDTNIWYSGVNFKMPSANEGSGDIIPILNMGNSLNSPLIIKDPSAVNGDNPDGLPQSYSLKQNYPNPFNPMTTIQFDLPRITDYTLTIFNVLGQKVDAFSESNKIGTQTIPWDGSRYASGIYFYKLETKDFVDTKKMVLLK